MGIDVFLTRILVCFILSVLVGIERQLRHKMVGVRTNVLVALGAFMFNWMAFSCDIPDRTRVASQIVSGIGFLGAGFIIKDGNVTLRIAVVTILEFLLLPLHTPVMLPPLATIPVCCHSRTTILRYPYLLTILSFRLTSQDRR